MRWDRGHKSDFVDDNRGRSVGGRGGGGGLGVLASMVFRRFGIVGVLIGGAIFVALQFFGSGARQFTDQSGGAPVAEGPDDMKSFISFVLDDLQTSWEGIMPGYRPARLTLFTGRTQSRCGLSSAAVGPFYCPGDTRVYIDLSFYRDLKDRLGAPGDFAQAYVIAHEIGHHVQNLKDDLGRNDAGADGGAVRVELQADCYAGVWAHSARNRGILEVGDIEEALTAAAAIGDDTLQRRQGEVRPESWTHGSAAQRVRWFERGLKTGAIDACDTFSVASP